MASNATMMAPPIPPALAAALAIAPSVGLPNTLKKANANSMATGSAIAMTIAARILQKRTTGLFPFRLAFRASPDPTLLLAVIGGQGFPRRKLRGFPNWD